MSAHEEANHEGIDRLGALRLRHFAVHNNGWHPMNAQRLSSAPGTRVRPQVAYDGLVRADDLPDRSKAFVSNWTPGGEDFD